MQQQHVVSPSPPRQFRSSSFSSSGIPLSPILSPHQSPSKNTTPTSKSRPVYHQHSSSSSSLGGMDFSSPRPSTPDGRGSGTTNNNNINNNNKPSTPGSGYTHPYRIQSSASGALTRSNSAQALSAAVLSPPPTSASSTGYGYGSWGYQSPSPGNAAAGSPGGASVHRSSKSLSNLRGSVSVDNLASRAMMDSPAVPYPLPTAIRDAIVEPVHLDAPPSNTAVHQTYEQEGAGTVRASLGSGRRYNSLSGTVVRPLVAQWTGEPTSSQTLGSSPNLGSIPSHGKGLKVQGRDGDSMIKPSPRRVEKFLWPEQAGSERLGLGDVAMPLEGGGASKGGLTEGEKRLMAALPANPKAWTPSDLSTFISISLIHGISPSTPSPALITASEVSPGPQYQGVQNGIDSQVRALPKEVVRDIENWVLRYRLDGKNFLRGGEGSWVSTAKPPPFLPVLLSLSRHLRRASLKGPPISAAFFGPRSSKASATPTPTPGHARDDSLHSRISSVLHEESGEDEGDSALTDGESEAEGVGDGSAWDDEDLSRFSKVKRMIGTYDARSASGSDVGDDTADEDAIARPEYTRARSSSISSTRSHASSISDRVEMLENAFSPRSSVETAPRTAKRLSKEPVPAVICVPEPREISPFGILVDHPRISPDTDDGVGLGISSSHDDGGGQPPSTAHSPPPAYASPDPGNLGPNLDSLIHASTRTAASINSTPMGSPVRTPRRQITHDSPQTTPMEPKHMSHMIEHAHHGARPYGALRRSSSGGSSSGGPRLPTLQSRGTRRQEGSSDSTYPLGSNDFGFDDDDDPRSTGRRVTLRPKPKVSDAIPTLNVPRTPSRSYRTSSDDSADSEIEMRRMLETLTSRLQAAEARIVELEGEATASKVSRMPLTNVPYAEKLPQGVRELPSYVAMVALGLSFVLLQTVLKRRT